MKVFISSTYQDLIEYRLAVADALQRLGLQVNKMETFGARPQEPVQACLAEIDASDLFVGIYARRYGFIPENAAISITEIEFDHAFNNRRPTFCFFLDDAYQWPDDFVEHEPGKSLLRRFVTRVEGLVVRDFFTTPSVLASRAASSIGRYLLTDPRRHGASSVAQFARLTLADTATMAFVDVMRLACVASSNIARDANQQRYAEFVDTADSHLNDFRTQVTRLIADADSDIIEKCSDVERGLLWAIVRLRRGPHLDRRWHEFAKILYELAERINMLAELVSHSYYVGRVGEISRIIQNIVQQVPSSALVNSPDLFVQTRFSAQSAVLEQLKKTNGFTIATIRDDMDRRLAISYYAVDLALLQKAMENSSKL